MLLWQHVQRVSFTQTFDTTFGQLPGLDVRGRLRKRIVQGDPGELNITDKLFTLISDMTGLLEGS